MLYTPTNTSYSKSTLYAGTGTTISSNGMGATLTLSTTNAYGTYVAVTTSAITNNAYGILINVHVPFGSATSVLAVKLGIDTAGGTNYTDFITDLFCNNITANYTVFGGLWYYFPIFIPAGSTIAAAARGTPAATCNVVLRLFDKHTNKEQIGRVGSYVEPIGITLGAGTVSGVNITAGTTTESAWTLIGTTTRKNWWWQLVATPPAGMYLIDLAVGDSTNKNLIFSDLMVPSSLARIPMLVGNEYTVPAGSNIYARVQGSSAGVSAICVYGCGG